MTSHSQSPIERQLEEMGVGDNDDSWDWFDPDAATAPERKADPETARKHLDDPEWLREQYVDQRRPSTMIAADIGVSKNAVLKALESHGIERRGTAPIGYGVETRRYERAELVEALEKAMAALETVPTERQYIDWREKVDGQAPANTTIRRRLGVDRRWESSLTAANVGEYYPDYLPDAGDQP